MCGIVGYIGPKSIESVLLVGLQKLEYRGYDSAGMAVLDGDELTTRKAVGKIAELEKQLKNQPLIGNTGIAHTRWATHGAPTESNAHPHASDRVAVVHNGIIENFRELREAMEARGRKFETETDSETIAHLIDEGLSKGLEPKAAFKATLDQLRGAFAIAAIIEGEENLINNT